MTTGDESTLADLSAIHRDLLWVLSTHGPSERHTVKQALEAYYSDGIDESQFTTALTDLTAAGLIVKRSHSNVTNKYHLTELARRALQARQAWESTRQHNPVDGDRSQ